MKYKILFVNVFPEIGGAETSLLYLLQSLDKSKFDPYVIVPQPGQFSKRLKELGIKTIFLPLPGYFIRYVFFPGMSPHGIRDFYSLCKKLKPDIIHLTHITQAIYAGIAGKLLHIPVVAMSWMNSDSVYFYQNIITNLYVNKILAVTPELKNRILAKGFINKNKITVLTPGIDTKLFSPTQHKRRAKKLLGINEKDLVITLASRFDPVKDHLTFLKAMSLVVDNIQNITILIAQDAKINLEDTNTSAPQIKKAIDDYLIKDKKLNRKTVFIGYKANMLPVYHATDIIVSSSLYESLGMILMESAACGLPAVSTDNEGQYIIIENGKNGFLVPVKRPDLLAEKIIILAKNEAMRKNFSRYARQHVLNNLNLKNYVNEMQQIYASLIQEK